MPKTISPNMNEWREKRYALFNKKIDSFKDRPEYEKLRKQADDAIRYNEGFGYSAIQAAEVIKRIEEMDLEFIREWLDGKNGLKWDEYEAWLETKTPPEFLYEINCGSREAMEMIAEKGRTALNPQTMKFQIIDKDAKYQVRLDEIIQDSETGQVTECCTLLSDKDLWKIAREKGLVVDGVPTKLAEKKPLNEQIQNAAGRTKSQAAVDNILKEDVKER